MSVLYHSTIWIESVCIVCRILIEYVCKTCINLVRSCGLSERSMRTEVCQPNGQKFCHILT